MSEIATTGESDETDPLRLDPSRSRRITFTATAYLRNGVPCGGFYDMHTAADGGMGWSMPEGVVDEDSVRDAPPEVLSPDDWLEIAGRVSARYGPAGAGELLRDWRALADETDAERIQALGDRLRVPLRGLPADSITALPPDRRLAEIDRRHRAGAYAGVAPREREAAEVIAHLLCELDQARAAVGSPATFPCQTEPAAGPPGSRRAGPSTAEPR